MFSFYYREWTRMNANGIGGSGRQDLAQPVECWGAKKIRNQREAKARGLQVVQGLNSLIVPQNLIAFSSKMTWFWMTKAAR
jgi:hypothetical protein